MSTWTLPRVIATAALSWTALTGWYIAATTPDYPLVLVLIMAAATTAGMTGIAIYPARSGWAACLLVTAAIGIPTFFAYIPNLVLLAAAVLALLASPAHSKPSAA